MVGYQVLQRSEQKLLLVAEVDVEGTPGYTSRSGHTFDRQILERAGNGLAEGGRDQFLPGPLVPAAAVMSSLEGVGH